MSFCTVEDTRHINYQKGSRLDKVYSEIVCKWCKCILIKMDYFAKLLFDD